MEKTKDKKEYVEAWQSHIKSLRLLQFTPSQELSNEVKETVDKMLELVEKVADDKQLS